MRKSKLKVYFKSSAFLAVAAFATLGCQKAKPNLSSLTALTGVTLDQSAKTVSSSSQAVVISGKCTKNFSSIEVSADGGQSWTPVSRLDLSANIDCQNTGTFSTSLVPNQAGSSVAGQIDSGSIASFQFRGNGSLGASSVNNFSISKFGASAGHSLVYGSLAVTGGGYHLTSRLTGSVSQTPVSSGGYKLKSSLKAR